MIIPASKKISIFSGWIENFNILFPLIVLFFAGIEICYLGPLYKDYSKFSLLITNVIFFNSTHIMLTFLMLYAVPAVSTWPAGLPGGSRAFWLKSALVYGLVFCAYLALDINLSPQFSDGFFFLFMIVQTHHVLAQTRGLSYCYNQQLKRADPEISVMKMKQSEWLEKWGFLIFLVSTVCLQQLYFNVEGQWRWLVYLAWAGLALGALMIYGGAFYFPNVLASNKIPFLLRLVVYPLGLFSLIASSAVGIAHGVEYVCVFHKISNRGISEKHKLKKVLLAGVLLMTVHGAVFTFRHTVGANVMLDSSSFGFMWLVALKALYSSLTLLHYYLDRQIFRMREPHTRSQIGPLIA